MRHLTPARLVGVLLMLLLALAAIMIFSSLLGLGGVSLGRALDLSSWPNPDSDILIKARLPRVVLAAIVGAALGSSGAAFQALLRNPLADPFVLGVSGGAALGGTIALLLGVGASAWGHFTLPVLAFGGAMGSVVLIYSIARAHGRASTYVLLLTGVVFNAFASAIIMFLKTIVSATKAQELLFWLMGYIGYEPWSTIGIMGAYTLVGLFLLFLMAGPMNALSLGEASAAYLGVNVERTRLYIFLAASLVVGAAVSVTGLIGFVGLIVPHGVRLLAGPDHRLLVPASALVGASFLVLADALARAAFTWLGTEPPVGVVTAFCGGPFFIFLLRRQGRDLTGELG